MRGAYRLTDSLGRELANTLTPSQTAALLAAPDGGVSNIGGVRTRIGVFAGASGSVALASTDPDLVASKKVFRAKLEILHDCLGDLAAIVDAAEERSRVSSRRLIHNLTSLNGHMIQDIYSVMSQDRLAGNIRRSIPLIVGEMQGKKVYEFAKCFLSLAKHSAAMKNEFSVFKKIGALDAAVEKQSHVMHKIVMNVAYLFFTDFADKNSYINVAMSTVRVPLDYEFAFVAFYHLFDNAAKYICPETQLEVRIQKSDRDVSIEFKMLSLEIADDEIGRLTNEGFSGRWPRHLDLHGSGVGLSLVDRVMKLHSGTLAVTREVAGGCIKDAIPYQVNTFALRFPLPDT